MTDSLKYSIGDKILHKPTGKIATIIDITDGDYIWEKTVTIKQFPYEPAIMSRTALKFHLDDVDRYQLIRVNHFDDEIFEL